MFFSDGFVSVMPGITTRNDFAIWVHKNTKFNVDACENIKPSFSEIAELLDNNRNDYIDRLYYYEENVGEETTTYLICRVNYKTHSLFVRFHSVHNYKTGREGGYITVTDNATTIFHTLVKNWYPNNDDDAKLIFLQFKNDGYCINDRNTLRPSYLAMEELHHMDYVWIDQ